MNGRCKLARGPLVVIDRSSTRNRRLTTRSRCPHAAPPGRLDFDDVLLIGDLMRLDAAAFSILLIGPVLAFAGQRQRPPANGLCVGFLADVIVRGLVSGAPAPGAGGTPLRSATVSIGEGPRQQRLTTDSAGRFTARRDGSADLSDRARLRNQHGVSPAGRHDSRHARRPPDTHSGAGSVTGRPSRRQGRPPRVSEAAVPQAVLGIRFGLYGRCALAQCPWPVTPPNARIPCPSSATPVVRHSPRRSSL
jgi:hypothetical protein